MNTSTGDMPNFNHLDTSLEQTKPIFNIFVIILMVVLGLGGGFLLGNKNKPNSISTSNTDNTGKIVTSTVTTKEELEVGKVYGNNSSVFTDTASGTVVAGNINGVGTHILERAGGISQRASLTSSVIDLDLFVGKKVEIKGQTNTSNKTSWLLDVGTIKIIE